MYTLMITEDCNYRCKYCYEKKHCKKFMSESVIESVVEWIANTNTNEVIIIRFHGGEPLLYMENIKLVVKLLKEKFTNTPIVFELTTNGSLITREIANYMKKHEFRVFISLDGDKKVNDMNRKTLCSESAYENTLRGVNILKEVECPFSIRGTVTHDTVLFYANSVKHLLSYISKNVGILPDIYNSNWDKASTDILMDQLLEIIGLEGNIAWTHKGEIIEKSECKGGSSSFFIDTDGNIYPCIYTYLSNDTNIGDVFRGIDKNLLNAYICQMTKESKRCDKCSYSKVCNYYRCRYMNKLVSGDYSFPTETLCYLEKERTIFLSEYGV